MNELLKELDFQVAFGAVRHFGRNLYTTNPPAIAELVANSWDAYAKKSIICYNESSMLIIDDGIGMTDSEFQYRYATSGNEKNTNIRKPDDMKPRPYMGRKGIGKFSAFSLADEYWLYTKSNNDLLWKQISLKQEILNTEAPTVTIPITRIDSLSSIENEFNINLSELAPNTGTLIYLPKLKRNVTETTLKSLQKLLSHRFSVTTILNDGNFNLSIYGNSFKEEIDLKKHFYYDNIEYIRYFGVEEQTIKNRFGQLEEQYLIKENDPPENIKGWIASVEVPSKLEVSEDMFVKGVSIYINGKLVDEDIFKNIKKDRMVDAYIIGEVDADYLGKLDYDVVLSSREGLHHEDKNVKDLKEYLEKIRKKIVSEWDNMRSKRDISRQDYIQRIINNPKNKVYYERLDSKAQTRFNKYAQKLFDRPKDKNDSYDALMDLMFSALLQIVNDQSLQDLLQSSNTTEVQLLETFEKIFNLTEINHAIRLRDSIRSNLLIIKELEKYTTTGEVEKVFEKHLEKNPWLIEPTWMANIKSIHTQNYYTLLNIDNNILTKLYTDLIVNVSDHLFPVIVEIKREKATNYSKPNVNDISAQIYDYKKALSEHLSKELNKDVSAQDIKAYFICGTIAFNKLDRDDRNKLDREGIIIKTYEQLIRTSRQIYQVNFSEDLLDQ